MRTSLTLLTLVGLALGLGGPLSGQATAAAPSAEALPTHQDVPGGSRAQPSLRPLDRPVSLHLRGVPLGDALKEINRQARLGLAYSPQVVPLDRLVTLKAAKITAGEALARLLQGTGARVEETAAGTVFLVKSEEKVQSSAPPAAGHIYGRVVDSLGEPLTAADVILRELSRTTKTNATGVYRFADVPAGTHTVAVRLVGYAPESRVVTVADSEMVRVDFALQLTATRLMDIVSTATGERRRVELGNDVTVIDADSIVRTQPITSVTDLLEGRVPGLVVERTSGAPGDPARLRLRGAGSPQLNNDPIVILDGIRVYSAQSDKRGANLATTGLPPESQYAAPSPLDYIDPNSIDRIEVLKGPSAATLYGQDAANGVIVITTKRGREGPARWMVSAEHGRSVTPGRYPDMFLRWGHRVADGGTAVCPLSNLDPNFNSPCEADSLVSFQLLNDRAASIFQPGHRSSATIGVDGGSGTLTYALTGSYTDEVGQAQLPGYEVDRFRGLQGTTPPDWMRRPQHLRQWGATARITAKLGPTAEVGLLSQLSRTRQQRSALERELGSYMTTYLDRGTGTYYRSEFGRVTPVENALSLYYERATAAATEFTNGVNLTWQARPWLTVTADAGLNVAQRSDQVFLPRRMSTGSDSIGRLSLGQGTSVMTTANVRAMASFPLELGFELKLATGVDYTGQSVADLTGAAEELAEGTSSPNQAAKIRSLTENRVDLATFGWFVEPSINHKRLWLATGLRLDGGSSYGSELSLPIFPKLSLSYLLSDEPFFPKLSFLSALRLRAAYGHAGRQPGPADRLRLFAARRPVWVDDRYVDGLELRNLGNTQLRPERTKELEGGVDLSLLDDRVQLLVTGYRKTTTDALMDVPVAPSVYGDGGQANVWRNIGVVRNEGIELGLATELLRGNAVSLSTDLAFARNRNVLVEMGKGVEPFNLPGHQRVAPGYPLYGRWAEPVVGYADADMDGVLEPGEVTFGDTAVYVGNATPDYTLDLSTNVRLLRGAVSISAGVRYEHAITQMNQVLSSMVDFSRGRYDPSAPLSDQMLVVALGRFEGASGPGTEYGLMRTVSALRFNTLSVSYNVPAGIARSLGARAMSVSIQGRNLALRTNYAGIDPRVNGYATGNSVMDTGVMPEPRTWQVRVNATY